MDAVVDGEHRAMHRATPATPIIGRTGSFSRSLQWITPFSTCTTRFWMPNSFCRTQSGTRRCPARAP